MKEKEKIKRKLFFNSVGEPLNKSIERVEENYPMASGPKELVRAMGRNNPRRINNKSKTDK